MAIPYEPTLATAAMRNTPRFGHSSDFAQVFGARSDASDYIVGLLFTGVFCLSIFILWTIAILVLKCVGSRRVGFLAGGPFIKPTHLTKVYKQPIIVRVMFITCGIVVMIFGILFVTEGLTNIQRTITTVQDNSQDVAEISAATYSLMESIRNVEEGAKNTRTALDAYSSDPNFCLNDASILEELLSRTGIDYSDTFLDTIDVATALDDFLGSSTNDLMDAAETTTKLTNEVAEQTNKNFEIKDWQSLIILIPFIVVPLMLLSGVVLAWLGIHIKWYKVLLSWVILPIFVIQTIFAYTFGSLIMIAASGNADFCTGGQVASPSGSITSILKLQGFVEQDLVYKIAVYYIEQCVSESPFGFLSEYSNELVAAQGTINALATSLNSTTTDQISTVLETLCGDSIAAFAQTVGSFGNDVISLERQAVAALELVRCENIVPLYISTFYEGTCSNSITGVTWCFAAFLVLGTMGLIMIMLRSAWQDVLETDAYLASVGKDSSFHDDLDYPEAINPYTSPGPSYQYNENYGIESSVVDAPINPYGDQSSIAGSAPSEVNMYRDQGTVASESVYTSSPFATDFCGPATAASATEYSTDYMAQHPYKSP